jgi:hypothetical protein
METSLLVTEKSLTKKLLLLPVLLAAVFGGGAVRIVQDQCGPFTDVTPGFCPYTLELYHLGITVGTSPTTFSPDDPLTRGQAAVFIAKGLNQTLARSSRRAALGQWWTPRIPQSFGITALGLDLDSIVSDGSDLWVTSRSSGGGGSAQLPGGLPNEAIYRLRASDGRLLETWTGVSAPRSVLVAMGRVFSAGGASPGALWMIDPSQAPGDVVTVAANLGDTPGALAFDGNRIWTANVGGSVSIITPGAALPWSVTTISTGFVGPFAVLFDGVSIWVTDFYAAALLRLGPDGTVLQTVGVGSHPSTPVFDGANIWVPNSGSDSVTVVRASTGEVLTTLTGNGLHGPLGTAFDGQRVLIVNGVGLLGRTVSLWQAAGLSALGSAQVSFNAFPYAACSDGINFWIAFHSGQVARF